ncbi:TetR family transcriptional regulator [Sulfurimonas aquatica]|uniref:TetR family transcriptional regulator n=1 Tax=Sulfurimonas aquatica TaxID=2672570 RepID=A0A975AYS8_9BACT|nr:TetR/AcrR family transcriptional regulator [Sulfurimonas aquatica]QSZ41082.1 TetR family transcriptional regulator [Sulfurimonas aquatica]
MARPIEYNLNEVLDSAMQLFWQKGYEGVSMGELVLHTGLNRATMYSLFKDKEGLFKDALENYYSKMSIRKLAVLKNNPGKKGIELFFETFSFNDNFKGCLFSNTMREKEFMHEETYNIPKDYFENVRLQMQINLEQASINGDFNGDAKSMALTLVTLIHGFHVYGKYNQSKEDSNAIITNILSMIR